MEERFAEEPSLWVQNEILSE